MHNLIILTKTLKRNKKMEKISQCLTKIPTKEEIRDALGKDRTTNEIAINLEKNIEMWQTIETPN